MIKAIIVDDELKGREVLANCLTKYCPDVKLLACADSVKSGIEAIKIFEPELVFLDIEMPDGTGFDLLSKITKVNFEIIFVTAYDKYAIKAIKFSALDYLLKPVDPHELEVAVRKVMGKNDRVEKNNELLEILMNNISEKKSLQRFAIPVHNGYVLVYLKDIVRLSIEEEYTAAHMIDGSTHVLSKPLKEFEKLLEEENFLRIHNSHIVNLAYIAKYIRGEGGFVVLKNKVQLEVSRRRKAELLLKLAIR